MIENGKAGTWNAAAAAIVIIPCEVLMETTLTINIPAPSARARGAGVGGGGGGGEKEEKIKVCFKLYCWFLHNFTCVPNRLILKRSLLTSHYTLPLLEFG